MIHEPSLVCCGSGITVYMSGRTITQGNGSTRVSERGTISDTDHYNTFFDVARSFKTTIDGCGGDSGSAIYTYPQAWAYGINSLRADTELSNIAGLPCRTNTIHSHANAVEDALDILICTRTRSCA